jgi:S-adenosylmethionine:tRNA ribosyltransferase-isomerase
VIPARLLGKRGEATVEVTLHQTVREAPDHEGAAWQALARPARKCRVGDRLTFGGGLDAEVLAKGEAGEITLGFGCSPQALLESLGAHGQMPLPPYIKRPPEGDPQDRIDYQTMFAERAGAIAAPTAALHFTPRLMTALRERGVEHAFVTLHVGAGTFLPVKAEDTGVHRMHAEWYEVPGETAARVGATRVAAGRIIAVGTTVLRALEAAADAGGRLRPGAGETRLFITPGYEFKLADLLLTNFHLPRSTLFMLVAAFAGLGRMKAAYAHAIARGYRFYSYGDACLLERVDGRR